MLAPAGSGNADNDRTESKASPNEKLAYTLRNNIPMNSKADFCRTLHARGDRQFGRTPFVLLLIFVSFLSHSYAQDNTNAPATPPSTLPASESRFLPWEKGSLKLGGFVSTFDSTLTFGRNGGSSATFNAEDHLGLDSSLTVIRAEAMYRPGSSLHHQLDFSWGSYHRDGQATVSEEFSIGDSTYPVGARLESVFNFDVFRATYSYAFLQNERLRLALGLGAYVLPVEYELNIQTMQNQTAAEGADITLPLPSLAFRADFQIIPKLFLNLSVDGMYLEINEFTGGLLDGTVAVEYRPWKHIGFGLGYSGMFVDIEDTDSDYPGAYFTGNIRVEYNGLLLYGKVSF